MILLLLSAWPLVPRRPRLLWFRGHLLGLLVLLRLLVHRCRLLPVSRPLRALGHRLGLLGGLWGLIGHLSVSVGLLRLLGLLGPLLRTDLRADITEI